MILGIGCDIVQVSRFAKGHNFLLRFAKKYFTDAEQEELKQKVKFDDVNILTLAVATRFTAKESVAKALGTGFRNGLNLKSIEIMHDKLGKPEVKLYNNALTRAYYLSDNKEIKIHLSLSNEREYVNAVTVMECI